jgi:ABC-type methionine transport system permease subunit
MVVVVVVVVVIIVVVVTYLQAYGDVNLKRQASYNKG